MDNFETTPPNLFIELLKVFKSYILCLNRRAGNHLRKNGNREI